MADMEKEGQRAIANKGMVLQAITLNVLHGEFPFTVIFSNSCPRGLNPEQQKQYSELLAGQTSPYKVKGADRT